MSFWRMNVLVLVVTILNQLEWSWAQTTDVTCLPYFDWMSNSQHQSPCVVASSLLAVCNGGSYNVRALPDASHYTGPTSVFDANDCQCNTVTYSLMSACAACQGRSYLTWSEWTANCPNVSTSFPKPLPAALHVPGWAYLDPTPSDSFDQIRARESTNLTESVLPTPTTSAAKESTFSPRSTHQTRTLSSTVGTILTSSTTTSSLATTSPVDLRHANTIGGIATGAAAAVFLLVCAVLWFMNSRFTRRMGKETLEPYAEDKNFPDTEKAPHLIMKASESNNQVHHNATTASRASPLHPL